MTEQERRQRAGLSDIKTRAVEDIPAVNPEDIPEDVKRRMQQAAGRTPKRKPTVQEQATDLFLDALAGAAAEQLFRAGRKGQLDWEIKGSFSGGLLLHCHITLTTDAEQEGGDSQDLYKKALAMTEAIRPYLAAEYRQLEAEHGKLWTMRELMTPDTREATDLDMHMVDTATWLTETPLGRCCQAAFEAMKKAGRPEHLPDMGPITAHTSIIGAVADHMQTITAEYKGDAGKSLDDLAALPITVSKAGKSLTTTNVILVSTDAVHVCGDFPPFYRSVYDAVCSVYLYGSGSPFTIEQLCRVMNNRTGAEHISDEYKAEVRRAVNDMICMRGYIDASEEAKMRHVKDENGDRVDRLILKDYLLPLREVIRESGGRTVHAYIFSQEPLMLTYSKAVNQYITVPADVLDIRAADPKGRITEARISANTRQTVIRDFLIREVRRMEHEQQQKRRRKGWNVFTLERVYSEAGAGTDKKQRSSARKHVAYILDSWTATGFIAGWNWNMSGKTYQSVTVKVNVSSK